jgi:type VI secretion system protein ImpC
MFKKIYEEEFGMFGGASYGALIGDYEFGNHPQDIALLEKMSQVAAAAHAPFISAAGSSLFNLDSFTDLGNPRDLSKIFQSVEYAKWRSFRDTEDSRYVALCVPHILMRQPYGQANVPVEAFDFEEKVDGTDHSKYLWGNAAYALGTRLTDAFAKYGWCAAIRGVEGGGLVEGLPVHTFKTDEGDVALKCPTEIAITDRREKELADLGFIPLVHCKGTDFAAFFSTQSANKPKVYDSDDANANARLSSQIQYIMATSRFAHYLKSMMRDKLGSLHDAGPRPRTFSTGGSAITPWRSQRRTGDESQVPAERSAGRCHRNSRKNGCLPGGGVSETPLSTGRIECFSAVGCRPAATGRRINRSNP